MLLAAAGSVHESERILFHVLLQLIVIILAARWFGRIAAAFRQPQVVGEIIAGLVLGPSLVGSLFPDTFAFVFHPDAHGPLQILSQVGLILLMFHIGLEFDFSHLRDRENLKAVLWIASAGVLCPFALGWALGGASAEALSPGSNRHAYQLFIAVALSITAVPVLGRIMMELNIQRSRIGVIAITCAALNDMVGWVLLAAVSAFATSGFVAGPFAIRMLLLVAYLGFCFWAVRPGFAWFIRQASFDGRAMPHGALAVVLALVMASAMVTYQLGIFAITGGFVMGVIAHEHRGFVDAWRRHVSDFVIVFFLPIFFTQTGLRTNIQGLNTLALGGWLALVLLAATLGKFGGAWLAGRIAGLRNDEACAVGVMMNTRALMELVVINIGFELGILPQGIFTMLVIMAVLSTIITGPLLRFWLGRLGYTGESSPSPAPAAAGPG